MPGSRPLSYVEVDLAAIAANTRAIRARLSPAVTLIAVVKANAYGHGLVPCARVMLDSGPDRLSVSQIAAQSAALIDKARSGGLVTDDYSGGTFTVTNLGMYDIDSFTAIINPPECAILAVGKIEKTPVVRDDAVVIRPMMTLSLTYDHRVVDGALAAQFLQRIKQILQNPFLLI